jgi:hypothetical protein
MKTENLKEIRKLIGLEISDSLKLVGTDELFTLCEIQSKLDKLIKMLDNPDYIKKV